MVSNAYRSAHEILRERAQPLFEMKKKFRKTVAVMATVFLTFSN